MGTEREFRVAIVEDEPIARELLTSYILQRPELRLVGIAKDGDEAINVIHASIPDLVFLDVDLPGPSGFQILERIPSNPYVIFTTGSRDSAVQAFDIGAVDYMVKPIPRDRFDKAVDRALVFFKNEAQGKPNRRRHGLFVTEKENHYLVRFGEIIYIASHENACSIHTVQRDYVTYSSLKLMERRLPPDEFIRIYKQYIVSIARIVRIQSDMSGNYTVFLNDEDETQLPVGRAYAARLKELMG